MRYAILSDVHSRIEKLEATLADAQARGAERIVSLGDVGDDDCVALLRQAGAQAVFGNYEVSGWRRLAPENRAWVESWPPMLAGPAFLAVHAVPWWPAGLTTIETFAAWRAQSGHAWQQLFPYLSDDEDYRWQAVAELEEAGKSLLFHGHTHRQVVWRCTPGGRLLRAHLPVVQVQPAHRYLVGVGSTGLPEDGAWSAYALYDEDGGRVDLIRLNPVEHRTQR